VLWNCGCDDLCLKRLWNSTSPRLEFRLHFSKVTRQPAPFKLTAKGNPRLRNIFICLSTLGIVEWVHVHSTPTWSLANGKRYVKIICIILNTNAKCWIREMVGRSLWHYKQMFNNSKIIKLWNISYYFCCILLRSLHVATCRPKLLSEM